MVPSPAHAELNLAKLFHPIAVSCQEKNDVDLLWSEKMGTARPWLQEGCCVQEAKTEETKQKN